MLLHASELLCDNSVKTRVNRSDCFEKLGFQSLACLLYFICLEIPQNFARNKSNCFFDKDLVLKAEFLKVKGTQ